MKNWKYTLWFGVSGVLFMIAVFFVSLSTDPDNEALLFLNGLVTILLFPVIVFLMGIENYWDFIFGLGGTAEKFYITIMVTTAVLGAFLQFAVIGHAVDHIVSFVKDSRKKKLTEPVVTEPLNKK